MTYFSLRKNDCFYKNLLSDGSSCGNEVEFIGWCPFSSLAKNYRDIGREETKRDREREGERYIYIYIYRERERERERHTPQQRDTERERERERGGGGVEEKERERERERERDEREGNKYIKSNSLHHVQHNI